MTDKQLKRIALEFRRGILGDGPGADMCFVVSAPLQSFLSAVYGIETKREEIALQTCYHVILRLSDGRILDATADQFGLEPVYLGPMPALYRELMEA